MLFLLTLLNGGLISQPKAHREDMLASYQSGMQVSSQTSHIFPCSWCEHTKCAEQAFKWLGNFKHITRKITRARFCLFLWKRSMITITRLSVHCYNTPLKIHWTCTVLVAMNATDSEDLIYVQYGPPTKINT